MADDDSTSPPPSAKGKRAAKKSARKRSGRKTAAKKQVAGKSSATREKSPIKYPPYVNAYGSISTLFEEIQRASVPPKVTQDFLESVLGLKSSSHRALIPLLKRLGFIDAGNVPTEAYRRFRDPSVSGRVMADRLRDAFSDVYRANEYAHTLGRDPLTSKLRTLTGAGADDPYIPAVVGTFQELVKLADFDQDSKDLDEPGDFEQNEEPRFRESTISVPRGNFGFSYTINLNLPATTEIEVFNAIFKSLKEHLLNER